MHAIDYLLAASLRDPRDFHIKPLADLLTARPGQPRLVKEWVESTTLRPRHPSLSGLRVNDRPLKAHLYVAEEWLPRQANGPVSWPKVIRPSVTAPRPAAVSSARRAVHPARGR